MKPSIASMLLAALLAGSLVCIVPSSGAEKVSKMRQDLAKIGPCVIKATFSSIYPEARLPTTVDELKGSCKAQMEGFKCIKDEVKDSGRQLPPVIKRGLQTFVHNRQRHQKKVCTNINSEASRQFVSANKCIRDKKAALYDSIDSKYANGMVAIHERNFNDSALELKYFCCVIVNYKKAILDNVGPECEAHKQSMEEMIVSVVPNDVGLLCEDEDKLTSKVCPSLEPLKVATTRFVPKPSNEPSMMTLYLLATLGEPEV